MIPDPDNRLSIAEAEAVETVLSTRDPAAYSTRLLLHRIAPEVYPEPEPEADPHNRPAPTPEQVRAAYPRR